MTYEILTDATPAYHTDRSKAVVRHNENGIRLWQRMDGVRSSVKPYATGDIPVWMIGEWYTEVPNPHKVTA